MFKQKSGITLIVLVVTIIVLVILAGVSINFIFGADGIFTKSQYAVNKYKNAQEDEQEMLNQVQNYINKNYIMGSRESSVTMQKVKLGLKTVEVPIPNGFYYVGGDLDTGVVISDNSADSGKYANIQDVPAGVAYNSDGTVNTENSALKGNQFVWIPVTVDNYKKTNWGNTYTAVNYSTLTPVSELVQIQKYGGFYIGRYEAGTSDLTLSTGINFSNACTTSDWMKDDYSIRDGLEHSFEGNITCKAGEIPYYHADYYTAYKLCRNMYKTAYVQSGLVTGTQWDVMLKYIAGNDDTIVGSACVWGNQKNGVVTYTSGQGRYATVDAGVGSSSDFKKNDGNSHYGINTTGISESVKKKNIYDVAGNLSEWTEESVYADSTESYVQRGGNFAFSQTACYRGGNYYGYNTATAHGFRPVLYIR